MNGELLETLVWITAAAALAPLLAAALPRRVLPAVIVEIVLGMLVGTSGFGLGARLGVIDAALNAAIILLAVLTCIVSPALFNLLLPAGGVKVSTEGRVAG